MRVTQLLDANGKVHLLANGDIATVTNLSRNPVEEFIEFNLAANADLNLAAEIIRAAGETLYARSDHNLKAAPHLLGLTAFTAASVTVRVSVVTDPRYLLTEQMAVRAGMREALLKAGIPPA
jgi:small-conductance mechanosensitive channel